MAVHARSDVSAVTISPEHGGCGQVHSRPVEKGAPVKLWSLTCSDGCENVLRKDAHWSGTISGIPETPDEKAYREDQELKGKVDQQAQTSEAIAKLAALGDLPAAIAKLAEMFSGEPKREDKSVECASCGASMPKSAKFCGACGQPIPAKLIEEPVVPAPLPDLNDLSDDQLRELAKERGLTPHHRAGKAKLIELIQGA